MEFMMLAATGHVAPAVAPWITYLFTGLLVAMVLCLALEEKIHAQKSVIVGVTAVIALDRSLVALTDQLSPTDRLTKPTAPGRCGGP